MKHYIDTKNNEIYAFKLDGSQDAYIKKGLVLINDADLAILRSQQEQSILDSLTYVDKRAAAYPSLREQADMQYWDQVNSTTTWKDTIEKIKAGVTMTRARDMANLGSQAGSGLDASDITSGVLPSGVTGGSGLNEILGRFLAVQVFTSSGTYTKTSGTNSILVYCTGGGASAGNGTSAGASGGGGAGGTSMKHITGGVTSITVTCGTGGAAVTSGSNAGTAGGTSSFGSHCSATGGSGGFGYAHGQGGGMGGNGGSGASGNLNFNGQAGGNGYHAASISSGANGGSTIWGGGGKGTGYGSAAGAGTLGSGGGGGGKNHAYGAAGGTGVIVVYEYS